MNWRNAPQGSLQLNLTVCCSTSPSLHQVYVLTCPPQSNLSPEHHLRGIFLQSENKTHLSFLTDVAKIKLFHKSYVWSGSHLDVILKTVRFSDVWTNWCQVQYSCTSSVKSKWRGLTPEINGFVQAWQTVCSCPSTLAFFLALWLQEVTSGHTDMYNLSLRGLFFFLRKKKQTNLV